MNRIIGIILTAISAAAFASLFVFGRYAYADGVDIYTFLVFRFGISAIMMGTIMLLRREAFPKGKTLLMLIGMGAIGYVGQSFSYLTAIRYASAGLVALLLYLYPIFVAILSSIFLHEKITPYVVIALAVALAGTALTVSPEGGQLPGILLALFAASIYSVYIIVGSQVIHQVSPWQSSTVIFASAALVYGTITIFSGPHLPATAAGWQAIAGVIVIATVIPVITFLAGIRIIGPTNASMLSTIEPVVTVILAAFLFKEKLSPITLFGGALILIAVIMITRHELRKV